MRRSPRVVVAVLSLLALALPAAAQDYPSRPIRAIASQGPGGLSDIWMRAVADELGSILGQPVVVEDRMGAAGSIGARACGEATPDGYTICILSTEALVTNPIINPIAGFDPKKSLIPITKAFYLQQVFAVNASLGVKNIKELVALAKAKPGALNYGATSSPTHLATELFASMAGVQLTRIPYKGAAPAMTALMAGDVQIVLSGIGTMLPQVKSGRLKGLAVTGAQRSPHAPEIPTVVESGFDYVATTWYGLLAPLHTPRPVIDRLNRETRAMLDDAQVKAQLAPQGVVAAPSTPEEFGQFLRAEVATWAKVVQATGARAE